MRRTQSLKGIIFNASVQYPRHIDELSGWTATGEIEQALASTDVPYSLVHQHNRSTRD
jgi:hypothetical protein